MKKKKTKHNGTPRRHHVPQPNTSFLAPIRLESAICYNCKKHFETKDIQGGWLDRSCPLCGSQLNNQRYENEALRLRDKMEEELRKIEHFQTELNDCENKRVNHSAWWFIPYRVWLKHRSRSITTDLALAEEKHRAYARIYSEMKAARYYTSEWYLNTHTALSGTTPEGDFYQLSPDFDKNDTFFLRPRIGRYAAGLAGEFSTYEFFQKLICCESSALYKGRLIPNVYLPRNIDSHGKRIWDQIDLIVALRQCAFVVEVKRWRHWINVSENGDQIQTSKDKKVTSKRMDASWALDQNSEHAASFNELSGQYPFDSIYELLLFVDPRSFSGPEPAFVNNKYVGCIPNEADSLVSLLSRTAKSECDTLSQEKLDTFAETFLEEYGDLNQVRGRIHTKRIIDLRSENL